jgi:hypothetical protein
MAKHNPPGIGGGDPDRKSGHAQHRSKTPAKSVTRSAPVRKRPPLCSLANALPAELWDALSDFSRRAE